MARRLQKLFQRTLAFLVLVYIFFISWVSQRRNSGSLHKSQPTTGLEHHLNNFKRKQVSTISTSTNQDFHRKPLVRRGGVQDKEDGLNPPNQHGTPLKDTGGNIVEKEDDAIVAGPKRKLQEKLDIHFKKLGEPYMGELWELSDYIPQWMKDYFAWHREERKKLTKANWKAEIPRILVMQCLNGVDERCGGTADRLKPFLFLLREAYESNRLILIHWTVPAKLEEFVVPPQHGIDWRVPEWMSEILHNPYGPQETGRKIVRLRAMKSVRGDNKTTLLRTRIQSVSGGAEYYDEDLLPGESNFAEVYHDAWRVFFTPSLPVRAYLESFMEKWNLGPGEYAAAHLRALYGRTVQRSNEEATEWTQNALNCASTLLPGGPYLFASDHTFSVKAALAYGAEKSSKVVARPHESAPLHLDNAENISNRQPTEFYDVFIDLYLLGMSRCLTYNRGGFGQWGLLIGYNSTCQHNQKTSSAGIGAPCNWTDAPPSFKEKRKAQRSPMFVPPLMDEVPESSKHRKLTTFSDQQLPVWMTDYFEWHQETRKNLNETNWKETKYAVMSCEKGYTSCGGISDRLKPLPFVVFQAAKHRRLLLINWEKPKPLEEFLVPPSGGMDWRIPSWLRRMLKQVGGDVSHGCDDCSRKMFIKADDVQIKLKIQTSGAGEDIYAKLPDTYSTYGDVFHGLFRAMFTPAKRLAAVVDQKMAEHGLIPGEYAAVHLRNMYGNRAWRHPNETIMLAVHGVNCASNLHPGKPVYFAADDKFAVEVAREYGRQRSLPVGSLEFNEDPIHIDKDLEWQHRNPSVYDDTFLDLYMLGQARCVAYSNGGYGSFGALLSYNSSCSMRYFKGRKKLTTCRWSDANGHQRWISPPEMKIPSEMFVEPAKTKI